MIKNKKPGSFFLCTSLLAAALTAPLASAQPASAANLFELLFGPPRQVQAPAYAPVDPSSSTRNPAQSGTGANSSTAHMTQSAQPSGAYCVRKCDGRFFPVSNADRGKTTALCNSMCPAAQTEIYYGSGIDNARNARGQSYADSPNAFKYRERIVEQCTCNGKTPFGLASIDYRQDPLIKSGDLVATNHGFVRASTNRRGAASFSPVKEAWLQNGLKLTSKHIAQTPKIYTTEVLAIRVHPARTQSAALITDTGGQTTMADATASIAQPVRRIDTPRILSTD